MTREEKEKICYQMMVDIDIIHMHEMYSAQRLIAIEAINNAMTQVRILAYLPEVKNTNPLVDILTTLSEQKEILHHHKKD